MIAKFVVVLDIDNENNSKRARREARTMALRNLKAGLEQLEGNGQLGSDDTSIMIDEVNNYDEDDLRTYWQCPECRDVVSVPAHDLDNIGTPICNCNGTGDEEMEWITHEEYDRITDSKN